MNPYILLCDNSSVLRIVDTREEIDYSQYMGMCTSSWKKVFTPGERNYFDNTVDIHAGGTHILTYEKGRIDVVNPGKGDYVEPGYLKASPDLNSIVSGYGKARYVTRAKLRPIEGEVLVNPEMKASVSRRVLIGVYRGAADKSRIAGWTIEVGLNSSSYHCSIMCNDEGYKCRDEGCAVVIYQDIPEDILAGKTRLRLRCAGTSAIFINEDAMHLDDGVWTWEGDALEGTVRISVVLNDHSYTGGVEFLDD